MSHDAHIPRLRSLRLKGILSFGAEMELSFRPLNVLVGANGSGKTNLLEVLGLLRALPRDISEPIQAGGGLAQWVCKGGETTEAEIEATWFYEKTRVDVRHRLAIGNRRPGTSLKVVEEGIRVLPTEDSGGAFEVEYPEPEIFSNTNEARRREARQAGGRTTTKDLPRLFDRVEKESRNILNFGSRQSILAQFRDPDRYPEFEYLIETYSSFVQFRRWITGPDSPVRSLQRADLDADFLGEDCRNLGPVLGELLRDPGVRARVIGALRKLYDGIDDIRVLEIGGFFQLNLVEEGDRVIPAERLSDGTLRYLCLLAILCHPSPPPLICIEEPELGLHPDVISTVADLLIEASSRTQLIVTTHSERLIDALGEDVESVVVCDRGIDGTEMKRLEADRLAEWLERYRLGDLWARGAIGGKRW